MTTALVTTTAPTNAEIYRASTDAAGLCRDIVLRTAMEIQKRKYVKVEGWQAIAIAHGCTGSARDVESVDGGVRAIGEVRRMSDGALIAQAEGFVGKDEPTWYGGMTRRWKWGEKRGEKVWFDEELPKRPDYAIRAMAQTRAISRACRSAFAHVVVLIDGNLSTTPAEEVPSEGFDNGHVIDQEPNFDDALRTEAKEPATPLWIVAARTAIDLCNSPADCKAWHDANKAMLDKHPTPEADEVIRYLNARAKATKPAKPKAAPAPEHSPELAAVFAAIDGATDLGALRKWSDDNAAALQALTDEDYSVAHNAFTDRAQALRNAQDGAKAAAHPAMEAA